MDKNQIIEALEKMTVLEVSELVKNLPTARERNEARRILAELVPIEAPKPAAPAHAAAQAAINDRLYDGQNVSEFSFSDKPGCGRWGIPRLFCVHPVTGVVNEFAGEAIAGVLGVKSAQYVKDGKWSHTEWLLARGTAPVFKIQLPKYGSETWADLARCFEILAGRPSAEAVETALRAVNPAACEAADRAAASCSELL